ncbi:MAG TPA: DUF2012 domain-containing protein [Pirellulales bacterium]|nr:DUF2012 domain-containing protein [Pirellulales bacterium]
MGFVLWFAMCAAGADDRPAAETKVVVGRVVDQNGQGVSDVKVWSLIDGKRGGEWHTDADGAFQAAVPANAKKHAELYADHPDFMRTSEFWSASDGRLNLPETVTFELEPGVPIGGVIQNEEGLPIENARVKLYLSGDGGGYELDVRTGADGRWRGRVPKDMRANQFWLYHKDHVCVTISRSLPPEGPLHAEQAVTVMKRGNLLQGKVHDSQGKPVAGALVLTQPYNVNMDAPDNDWTTTRTQADGTFAVRNMAAGPGAVAVYAASYGPEKVAVDVSDATPPVEIELSPPGELNGQIIDERGEGVEGVWVQAREWQPEPSFPLDRETRTDRDGRFHLGKLPRYGWFELNYGKQGFLYMQRDEVQARSEPSTFRIARPTTIRGQVLDDETGEPIKDFTVAMGRRWSRSEEMVFNQKARGSKAVHDDEGRFAVPLEHTVASPPFPEVAAHIVAKGYLPAETGPVAAGEQPEAVTLRLRRGEPIAGRLIDAAGQSVPKAQVAWVGAKRTAFIQFGKFMEGFVYGPEIIVETDADGKFELPASLYDGLIVVLHERGYAERRRSKLDAASPLQLIPWARVEGRALAGLKPIADVNVALTPLDPKVSAKGSEVSWYLYQQTHTDGSFAFDFLPSIPFTVAWHRALMASHKTPVNPKAGETVQVQIGGNGGAVSGRLQKPAGLKMDTFTDDFEVGINCTQVVAYPAEQVSVKKEARDNYVALLKSDGTFTIHDLPPGQYRLEANVHAAVPANSCGLPVSLATARAEFRIASDGTDVPLQLPELELTLSPGPQVGQMAPALTGKTLSGEPFDLVKLRGKPVLLDFWGTWCGPCKAATPALKRLYEKYGRDGKMAFVGIDLDYTAETAANYVAEHGITWPQVATGSWGEENAVLRSFAVTSVPSFWLIGADGAVLARDLPLGDLDRRIEAILRHP